MSALTKTMQFEIEGRQVQVLEVDGVPLVEAGHLSEVLGYSSRGRLTTKIRGDWSDEFEEGRDYLFASADITPIRGDIQKVGRPPLLLTESGWNLVFLKSRQPFGVILRRALAEDILPQIRATGQYVPGGATTDDATTTRVSRLESDVAELKAAMVGVAQGIQALGEAMAGMAQGIQALAQSNQARLPGPTSPGVTVNLPGAHVHITEPLCPPEYSVHGLKQVASMLGVSHRRMRTRLEATRLWGAEDWMWTGQRVVPRGNRLDTETVYRFKPGILAELDRREAPLFGDS
jgi:prophage antirepressor-like protein